MVLQTTTDLVGILSSVAGLAGVADHWYKKKPLICKQLLIQ